MSTSAQIAVLGSSAAQGTARQATDPRPATATLTITSLSAFTALALYAALRWSTMLGAPYAGRSLGLVLIALVICLGGAAAHAPRRRVRLIAMAATTLASLAMFPAAGIPLELVLHLRIGAIVTLVGHGLGSLPDVIVPYTGSSAATATVIRLGAAMLLLGSALTVGTSRTPRGEARLAAAALPLIVLATIPSCLARPQVPYLHGVILFALLGIFVFSERLVARPGAGIAALTVAAILGLVVAPAIDPHRPWIKFASLAGGAAYGSPEHFNWSQTYGPLQWPKTGSTVFDVEARFPYYWKAADLDAFDGYGWISGPSPTGLLQGVSRANLARWTQALTVTIRGLRTPQVVTAGQAETLTLPDGDIPENGSAPGTYVATRELTAGMQYTATAYTPNPTAAELTAAGTDYPASLSSELQMELPDNSTVQFARYGRPLAARDALALEKSDYARVYALSRRLLRGTSTPEGYVQAVMSYLQTGFRYTTDPRPQSLPLVAFLLQTHAGYCQQFAGAMALLLRMGGVPARVAVGFTIGDRQPGHQGLDSRYVVTDVDAHAWVEAWFPGIGWAKFDPTPPAPGAGTGTGSGDSGIAPGLQGGSSSKSQPLLDKRGAGRSRAHPGVTSGAATTGRRAHHSHPGRLWPKLLLGIIVLVSLGFGLAERARRRSPPSPERLVSELERAFARAGRPLAGGVTLHSLEQRFGDSAGAASYIRTVREARYADTPQLPSRSERRALRARLRHGLGPLGAVRALIALPPRL